MNSIIIIGRASTGKSRIARAMLQNVKHQTFNGRIFLSSKNRADFNSKVQYGLLWPTDPEAEYIHIDDFPLTWLEDLRQEVLSNNSYLSNRQSKPAVEVSPCFIITIEGNAKDLPSRVHRSKHHIKVWECMSCTDSTITINIGDGIKDKVSVS